MIYPTSSVEFCIWGDGPALGPLASDEISLAQ